MWYFEEFLKEKSKENFQQKISKGDPKEKVEKENPKKKRESICLVVEVMFKQFPIRWIKFLC